MPDREWDAENPAVVHAQNGEQAVWEVARTLRGEAPPFDVVLMDVHMPRLDGLEAAAEIRRLADGMAVRAPPMIALTANAFPEDRQRYLALLEPDLKPTILPRPLTITYTANAASQKAMRSRRVAASRSAASSASSPFGRRKRISNPRPLTLRSSHVQANPSAAPSARANPVMLEMAIRPPLLFPLARGVPSNGVWYRFRPCAGAK